MMLKVFVKQSNASEPITHLFHFNSQANPRGEANAIKDTLATSISAIKATDPNLALAISSALPPTTITNGRATTPKLIAGASSYDDSQLRVDIELQQSLMRKDPTLHQTYEEARRTKPDTITNTQFNSQFWSTRTNLLRAYAVEIRQQRGAYNVLSAVKPRQEDGELKLRISKEQVQLIFNQHPLVKRVYDENVPKLDEKEFWSRFFLSRLFKKLKGERIVDADSTDAIFDRYLDATEKENTGRRLRASHVPHVIDLQGNEENQGGIKSGNQKDFTMRPTSSAKAPIIRMLNSLSEKIMANVAPSDIDPADPMGFDVTSNELILRDLQGDPEENRIILKFKEQYRFFSKDKPDVSGEAALYAKQVPSVILSELQRDLNVSVLKAGVVGGLDLRTAIGVIDESESDDEGDAKLPHVGSKASLIDAQNQVFEGIKQQKTDTTGSNAESDRCGLSLPLFERLALTHATTTEFLRHFWNAFLSGDPDRAEELSKTVETLERSRDRIDAVALDAEKERVEVIRKQKQHIREIWEKTGKKILWKEDSIGGGEDVVREMLTPTLNSLNMASQKYRQALAAEGGDIS